jgi:hypothetical protein
MGKGYVMGAFLVALAFIWFLVVVLTLFSRQTVAVSIDKNRAQRNQGGMP